MATLDERISKLQDQLNQAKAKKQRLDARKRAIENRQKRSDDTRRKILVGSAILAKVEHGEWPRDKMLAMLDSYLTRDDDRELFGLARKGSTSHPEATFSDLPSDLPRAGVGHS